MKICDSCGYGTKTNEYAWDSVRDKPTPKPMNLCTLCADTLAGNTVQYPRENQDILRTICHVGNAILDEIRSFRKFSEKHK